MGKENDFKIKKLNTILTEEGSLEFFNAKASEFQCLNKDVETFLREKAVSYEQRGKSRTHIIFDEDNGDIVAYFTLSLKSVDFGDSVSKSTIKDIDGFSKNISSVAVILIGQFGKNLAKKDFMPGIKLLETAIDVVCSAKDIVGGRICLLETEDTPENKKVIDFYLSNGFKVLQHDKTDRYLQMFRKL